MECKKNCKDTMQKLRAVDFALVETALFLDGYPDNAEALAYYHELKKKREELYKAYTTSCGPLTIFTNESDSSWSWAKTPWPWELDAD